MKKAYLVADIPFNRTHNAEMIGQKFQIAPSYTAVMEIDVSIEDSIEVWENFAAFYSRQNKDIKNKYFQKRQEDEITHKVNYRPLRYNDSVLLHFFVEASNNLSPYSVFQDRICGEYGIYEGAEEI